MQKLKINHQTLTDIINIYYDIFHPIKKFLSKKDFFSVIKKKKLSNGKFFPFPIFFSVNETDYRRICNEKKIQIIYDRKLVCTLKINSFYGVAKKKIGKKIFNTSNLDHPGFRYFIETGNYNIDCEIKDFNKQILNKINFSNPNNIKKIIKKRNLKTIVGFHTRNVPHRAHEWIHSFGLKNCEGLLVQPMIGQFKNNEYKSEYILNSNKKLVENIYKKKNILFTIFNSYPRYGGPREALLHALVRRNFGCTHFLVGRDHAGYKNFYKKYESQNLCKKNEKNIKIKILKFNEPFLCKKNKKVLNDKKLCKGDIFLISGTYIRNLLLKKKSIPSAIMRKEISVLLDENAIIKKINRSFL